MRYMWSIQIKWYYIYICRISCIMCTIWICFFLQPFSDLWCWNKREENHTLAISMGSLYTTLHHIPKKSQGYLSWWKPCKGKPAQVLKKKGIRFLSRDSFHFDDPSKKISWLVQGQVGARCFFAETQGIISQFD